MVGAKNAHRERQVESCGMEVLLFGQVLAMKSAGYIFCDSFIHILIAYMHQRLTGELILLSGIIAAAQIIQE